MRTAIILAAALACAAPSLADSVADKIINPIDRDKLKLFDEVKKDALAEAEAAGPSADLALLKKALAGKPMSMSGSFKTTGKWRCQMIKVGSRSEGLLPIVSYPAFKCRIREDGGRWFLEKVTGSQRTAGFLYTDSDMRLIYLGAGTVNDDPRRKYNDDVKYNEPAYVTRLGKNKLVFEFPGQRHCDEYAVCRTEGIRHVVIDPITTIGDAFGGEQFGRVFAFAAGRAEPPGYGLGAKRTQLRQRRRDDGTFLVYVDTAVVERVHIVAMRDDFGIECRQFRHQIGMLRRQFCVHGISRLNIVLRKSP